MCFDLWCRGFLLPIFLCFFLSFSHLSIIMQLWEKLDMYFKALYILCCSLVLLYLNYCVEVEVWGNTYKCIMHTTKKRRKKAVRILSNVCKINLLSGNIQKMFFERLIFLIWKIIWDFNFKTCSVCNYYIIMSTCCLLV